VPPIRVAPGDFGEDVARVHEALARRSFEVSAEERKRRFFGPTTQEAVRRLQSAEGLERTGEVRGDTAALLTGGEGGPPPPLEAGLAAVAMPAAAAAGLDGSVPLVGVGSDGQTVEQWDGHRPPAGVMLRWFAPDDIGYPDFGFDVYRANVFDVHPVRFDDVAIAPLVGKQHAVVDDEVELETSDPAGLTFQPYGLYNALLVPAGTRLIVRFPGRAWDLYLSSAAIGTGLTVEAFAVDVSRRTDTLPPDQQLTWRTHGIERLEITGDGAISFLGYRLVNAPYQWVHLAHRSLPVSDGAYPDPAKPAPGGEEAEARARLPVAAQSDWAATYGAHFAGLLPTLTALALHQPAPAVPVGAAPDPRLSADGAQALRSALVDPHVGRLVGLAYDDLTAATVQQLLAYKVVGRWMGATVQAHVGDPALSDLGLGVELPGGPSPPARPTERPSRSIEVDLGRGATLGLTVATPVERMELALTSEALEVSATNAAGALVAETRFAGGSDWIALEGPGIARILLQGSGVVTITALRWRVAAIERFGLIPGMSAGDPGPPAGPSWIAARLASAQETLRVEAELDWESLPPPSPTPELGAIGVQVAGLRFGADPAAAQPPAPAFARKYLLRDGAVVILPEHIRATPSPRVLLRDAGPAAAGLAEGWYAWWARGVDLFGRCSPASPPAVLAVEDSVLPPPPMLVLAEEIQADLPPMSVAVLGRSPLATAWLEANPGVDGLACCLAWTPELARAAPDVDAFRVYVRRPTYPVVTDPRDPAENYEGVPWAGPVTAIGPVATHIAGALTAVGASIAGIAVTAVEAQPVVDAAEPRRFRLVTDVTLDTGSGALVGATVSSAGTTFAVVGNGEGDHASLLVTAPAGASAPAPGAYDLAAGSSPLMTVDAGVPAPTTGDLFKRAYAGTLTVERQVAGATVEDRHRVLGRRGSTLLCARDGGPAPAVGASATWYPAWALTTADTGFGPLAGATHPVAKAQVAATAIRRSTTTRALESARCAPATVVAIDTTVPKPPTLPEITTLPSDHCAQLATRADWYGVSRYTISFAPDATSRYVVTRALDDAIFRLDHARRRAGPNYAPDLSASWMAPLLSGVRGQVVTADLAGLTAALAAAGQDDVAIDAAYAALHVDAARIIAAQTWVAPAYVQRHGAPLSSAEIPYVDELEGRSRAHWFYRVTARSPAGVDSAPSPPTPPICCPDVTPPSAPVARLALAKERAVEVSWLPVPDTDVDRYLLFRGRDDADVADVRDLMPVRAVSAASVTSARIAVTVPCDPGEWRFRVVAVDTAGNRSRPSSILAGRALLPPPTGPEWLGAVRAGDTVHLTWRPGGNPPQDPRLACLVERRSPDGGFWSSVSGWLPRAIYTYDDQPPEPDDAWHYRLRVRDVLGQVALELPTVTVPEL
jgi:hypothetical protein